MILMERWFRFIFEGFVLYLLFIPFYMHDNQLPPIVGFLLVLLFSSAAIFLFFRNQKTKSYAAMMAFMPFAAALAWLLGFPIILAVALGALSCWRAFLYFFRFRNSSDGPNSFGLFFCALVFAMCLYAIPSYAYRQGILILMLSQFLFLLFMKGWERLSTLPSRDEGQRRSYLRWGFGTFASLVGVSALLITFYPAVKWVIFSGFSLLASSLGYVISYPIYWLFSSIVSDEAAEDVMNGLQGGDEQHREIEEQPPPDDGSTIPCGWIFLGIAAVAFIIVFIVAYRRRSRLSKDDKETGGEDAHLSTHVRTSKKSRKKRGRPPKNGVRRRFYQMQKVLTSRGFSRSASESIEEWFARLDFPATDKEAVAIGYRKVRYGDGTLSTEEARQYEQAVDSLIRRAKENKKQKK